MEASGFGGPCELFCGPLDPVVAPSVVLAPASAFCGGA